MLCAGVQEGARYSRQAVRRHSLPRAVLDPFPFSLGRARWKGGKL
jgi:hypothetical protein